MSFRKVMWCYYSVFLDLDYFEKSWRYHFTFVILALLHFRILFLPSLTDTLLFLPKQKLLIPQKTQKQELLIRVWHYFHRNLESKLCEGWDFPICCLIPSPRKLNESVLRKYLLSKFLNEYLFNISDVSGGQWMMGLIISYIHELQ